MGSSKRRRLMDIRKGIGHWRWQRISALLLIPLSIWLIVSFSNVAYNEYQQALAWVSAPLPGLLLAITLISLLFHGHLGIVVVIDDYVRGPSRKKAIQLSGFLTAFTGLFAVGSIVAILIAQ